MTEFFELWIRVVMGAGLTLICAVGVIAVLGMLLDFLTKGGLLVVLFLAITFIITACTSGRGMLCDNEYSKGYYEGKKAGHLEFCTRSKLKLDVQLNGVGPEEIEKVNEVTAECMGER